jgi:hypothetical protein
MLSNASADSTRRSWIADKSRKVREDVPDLFVQGVMGCSSGPETTRRAVVEGKYLLRSAPEQQVFERFRACPGSFPELFEGVSEMLGSVGCCG